MERDKAMQDQITEATRRLRAALEEMLDAGGEWQSEIGEEIEELDEEGRTDFFLEAASACDMLGGLIANVITGVDRRKRAAATKSEAAS